MTRLKTKVSPPTLAYGIADTAQMLGVSRDVVLRMLARGELEKRKAGARVIIPRSSIEAFLAEEK